jgi:hypothetical protein
MKLKNFANWISGKLSKIGHQKKCQKIAIKFVFFNEKKIRKIQMIFDLENDFESQSWALFDTFPLLQLSK